jgi:uncharacterized damage-inducible protein DinB
MSSRYSFLCDTYETEIMKTLTIWSQFPLDSMDFRPAPKSRSVIEQFDHQIQSEGKWMPAMLGIDVGDINPAQRTKEGYIQKYGADANRRLNMLREKDDAWWEGHTKFFDVDRSRAWVMTRRMTHSSHHRGQLIVYLRLLELRVPSVYGPTADTDGKVIYSFSG